MESISATKPAVSRWRWGIHLALITGYILTVGLLGLKRQGTHSAALSESVGGLLSVCSLDLLVFGVILGLACLASRPTRDELRLRWRGKFEPVLLGAGYSIALRIAMAMVVVAIGTALLITGIMTPAALKDFFANNRPDVETLIDMDAMRNNPLYYWLTVTVVSLVVGGLREELWRSAFLAGMKGLWPRHFSTTAGKVAAVLICGVIFGLGHLAMGPMAVCLAGFIGMGLGLIMIFHNSIWPAVIAHGLFDAMSMAMLPWALSHMK